MGIFLIFSKCRCLDISIYRHIEISTRPASFLNPSCPVALWVCAATPEFGAGIDAFLGHSLNHGFATAGTGGGFFLDALLRPIRETLGGERLCETTFCLEGIQLAFYLAANHLNETIAEDEEAVGRHLRVAVVKPLVELVFLGKYVDAAFVQDIVFIDGAVQLDAVYCLIISRLDRPRNAFLSEEPVEIVVGQFSQSGSGDIGEFHLRLLGSGMAGTALGNVGRGRACRHRHLVKQPSTRVIGVIQIAKTEILSR